jgi:hypothetical protein
MLKQHATSVASCMVILGNNRLTKRKFFHFPIHFYPSHYRNRRFESYQVHLITRLNELDFIDIEEVEGSKPSWSIENPQGWGFVFRSLG